MPVPKIRGKKRAAVFVRAGYRCEYCRTPVDFAIQPFVIEHILPVSRGGKSNMDNLACACGGCNGHKYQKTEAIDPAENSPHLLYNPRKDHWPDHFAWNANFTQIIGLTGTGRATVEALQLNRNGLVNIRRLMVLGGVHPPSDLPG